MTTLKNLHIKIEEHPKEDVLQKIKNPLRKYNEEKIGFYCAKDVVLSAYDKEKFIGGIAGKLQLGWLFIDWAWIDEPYRHKKLGSSLLLKLEEIAREHGINRARLNTASFQDGLSFYKSHGYRIFSEIEITTSAGKEYIDYFLRKDML